MLFVRVWENKNQCFRSNNLVHRLWAQYCSLNFNKWQIFEFRDVQLWRCKGSLGYIWSWGRGGSCGAQGISLKKGLLDFNEVDCLHKWAADMVLLYSDSLCGLPLTLSLHAHQLRLSQRISCAGPFPLFSNNYLGLRQTSSGNKQTRLWTELSIDSCPFFTQFFFATPETIGASFPKNKSLDILKNSVMGKQKTVVWRFSMADKWYFYTRELQRKRKEN